MRGRSGQRRLLVLVSRRFPLKPSRVREDMRGTVCICERCARGPTELRSRAIANRKR